MAISKSLTIFEYKKMLSTAFENNDHRTHKEVLRIVRDNAIVSNGFSVPYYTALCKAASNVAMAFFNGEDARHDGALISLVRMTGKNWKKEVLAIEEFQKGEK